MYPFRNKGRFYVEELLAPRPNPPAGGPPLVVCPRLLFPYIRSYPAYWRPFLDSQPEYTPCRGDWNPLMASVLVVSYSGFEVEIKIGLSSSDACNQSVQDRLSFRLLSNDSRLRQSRR
jgi:hypothetical protein